jgi:acyl-CoA thioesterase I
MILRYLCLSGLVAAALAGCEPAKDDPAVIPSGSETSPQRPTILFLGTSLTAGYGIDPELAYPALIQQRIDSAGLNYHVVNAGVSGETSAGALRRVDWLLQQQPVSILVLETGANDGLRGLPSDSLRANIRTILERTRELQPAAKLVLVGMRMPPNYGRSYTREFESVYPELARSTGAALVPFLLEGIGGVNVLNQPDGVHPTADGHRKMAETVWRVLERVLREGGRSGKDGRSGSGNTGAGGV